MAYAERDLNTEWIPQIRFPNGNNITLDAVADAIQEECDANGIPVAFQEAEVKTGGMFSKTKERVLLMYNPNHANDYLRFIVRLQYQGRYAFLHVYNMGGSKNYRDDNQANAGGTFGLIKKIGNAVGGHNAKLQQEENYYMILQDCLSNVTGVNF